MAKENQPERFDDRLAEELEEIFPKLNADDTLKCSSNNRSAALVLYAKACIIHREELATARAEERKRTLHKIFGDIELDEKNCYDLTVTKEFLSDLANP